MLSRRRRGPPLPYELLAGVVPCPGGWLVSPGKLLGISLYPEPPEVVPTLREVVDHVPEYAVIALATPIGLPSEPTIGGRSCDREARKLLGSPRRGSVLGAPCSEALDQSTRMSAASSNGGHMDVVTWALLPKLRESAAELFPYSQRRVFEVHPELSFYQMNDDEPLVYRKHRPAGRQEREALLLRRIPDAARSLDAIVPGAGRAHIADATAALWTARRIFARAVQRLPEHPEWNADGMRMEMVR